MVTANKRAESIQDVAISINAYSGSRLEATGISSTQDLQILEPSLVFTTNAAFGQPYLRGVGTDLFTPGAESSVATFVDDVYQSRTASSIQDFFDVERVSVVKGPQGVLFGRNAVGGAINIYTNKPTDEFEGRAAVSVGNFSHLRLEGVINAPLSDTAALRIAAVHLDRDGFTENVETGGSIDSADTQAIRAHLAIQASDKLDLLFSANYSTEDSTRNLAARVNVDSGLALSDVFGANRPEGTFELALNDDGTLLQDAMGFSFQADYDLGWASLKSITSYRDLDLELVLDLDASQLEFASNRVFQESQTFTQEFQLVSTGDGPVEWVLGGFYLSEEASQQINVRLQFPVGPPNLLDQIGGEVETESIGIFGNVKYRFSDRFAASLGARYNRDDRELDFLQTTTLFGPFPVGPLGPPGDLVIPAPNQDEEDFDDVTPSLVLEYTPSEDTLIYGSISRGYKAGGFNTNVNQGSFDEESLWAYEVGLKSTFWNGRGRFNGAVFYYDYTDIQLLAILPGSEIGGFQSVINAAGADIKGVEGDFSWVASDRFMLTAGFAFLDAEYSEFVATNPNFPTLLDVDRSGDSLTRSPEFSFNLGAEYSTEVGGRELRLRADYRYESDQFLDAFSDPLVARDSNSVLNARIEYQFSDSTKLSLWGKNLTDEETVASALRVDGLFGAIEFYMPPRTYGATLETNF